MELWTVEVGCRGFAGLSVRRWIRALGVLGYEAEKWVGQICRAWDQLGLQGRCMVDSIGRGTK